MAALDGDVSHLAQGISPVAPGKELSWNTRPGVRERTQRENRGTSNLPVKASRRSASLLGTVGKNPTRERLCIAAPSHLVRVDGNANARRARHFGGQPDGPKGRSSERMQRYKHPTIARHVKAATLFHQFDGMDDKLPLQRTPPIPVAQAPSAVVRCRGIEVFSGMGKKNSARCPLLYAPPHHTPCCWTEAERSERSER